MRPATAAAPRVGFSPRKAAISLYLVLYDGVLDAHLKKLGKHKAGKGCLYVNKLADVDMAVLKDAIRASWQHMQQQFPR